MGNWLYNNIILKGGAEELQNRTPNILNLASSRADPLEILPPVRRPVVVKAEKKDLL